MLFITDKNWAPPEQFVRVGGLFAAPWSSNLLATLPVSQLRLFNVNPTGECLFFCHSPGNWPRLVTDTESSVSSESIRI